MKYDEEVDRRETAAAMGDPKPSTAADRAKAVLAAPDFAAQAQKFWDGELIEDLTKLLKDAYASGAASLSIVSAEAGTEVADMVKSCKELLADQNALVSTAHASVIADAYIRLAGRLQAAAARVEGLEAALRQARTDLIDMTRAYTDRLRDRGIMVDATDKTYAPYVARITASLASTAKPDD
jgi:hypothetical protein